MSKSHRKPCIYIVKNIINHKCYVGQTYYGLTRRKHLHLSSARRAENPTSLFHKALKYWGPDQFEWSVLEEIENFVDVEDLQQQLNQREIFWIAEKQAYGENGYNMNRGGGQGVRYKYTTWEEKKKAKYLKKRKYRQEHHAEHRAKQNARNALKVAHRKELRKKYKSLYPERYDLYKKKRREYRREHSEERKQRKKARKAWLAENHPEILEAKLQKKRARQEARKKKNTLKGLK